MVFTERAIAYHLGWFLPKAINHGIVHRYDMKRTKQAVQWLLKNEIKLDDDEQKGDADQMTKKRTRSTWIYQEGGGKGRHYKKTNAGERAFSEVCAAPVYRTGQSDEDFRTEALTGTTKNGKPSPLKYHVEPNESETVTRLVDGKAAMFLKGGVTIALSDLEPALPSRSESLSRRDPESYLETFLALGYVAKQFGILQILH